MRRRVHEATAIYPEFVSRLGPDHELTMQLLATRAQSEGSLELWDDAVRDDLAIYDLAVKKQGPGSFFAVATLTDAALAQCRAGHDREGEQNARKAYEASTKAFGGHAALTGATAYTLANCLISLNKLDEATALLKQIDVKPVTQLTGDPDWGAGVTLTAGRDRLSPPQLRCGPSWSSHQSPCISSQGCGALPEACLRIPASGAGQAFTAELASCICLEPRASEIHFHNPTAGIPHNSAPSVSLDL